MKWRAAFMCVLQHSSWYSAACSVIEQYSAVGCAASGLIATIITRRPLLYRKEIVLCVK